MQQTSYLCRIVLYSCLQLPLFCFLLFTCIQKNDKHILSPTNPLGFFDPEGGSQKATLVVLLVVVVISSLKIPKAFLIHSGAQQNFAYTFMLTLPTDLPSQIFYLVWQRSVCSVACTAAYQSRVSHGA